MILGLNNHGMMVGVETDATDLLHGVIYDRLTNTRQALDHPNGIEATTFNGLNEVGQVVGYCVNSNGDINGMLVPGLQSNPVPEPSTRVLFGIALIGLNPVRHCSRA